MSNSHIRRKSLQNGVEILVRGIVQGVGFRPFVFRLASRFHISGTVTNTNEGVVIQARGPEDGLFAFIDAISQEAPPLAQIIDVSCEPLNSILTAKSFTIIPSQASDNSRAIIPPDISVCEDCTTELTSSSDRRYRYPFTNCTNCGPRFSIVETVPYDRSKTSMKLFEMCALCAAEYDAPADRRFHAQPNACSACGPQISWHDQQGNHIPVEDILAIAIEELQDDKIIALRGLGGFHLCTNGLSEHAVETLRHRKNRPDKPLAIMVQDLKSATHFCHVSESVARIMNSPAHPIVLLSPKTGSGLAENLAPDMSDIGVMLPYTPLHHLLFEKGGPTALVMTSGNTSGEPICTSNEDALSRLSGIADFYLLHNRNIVTRVDDSVVKSIAGTPRLLRRSRGYVPSPLLVPYDLPEVIGCGGGLKSTFSLSRGKTIFPSQHIGDLFNLSSYEFYLESIANLKRLLEIEPVAVCRDMHPDYLSSHYADEFDLPRYEIQHHHAHAVSVMAEHGLTEPVLGIILDGTGYGPDGTIWGGEILRTEPTRFSRLASLEPLALPGGDAAAEEPWRMGLSLLYHLFGPETVQPDLLGSIAPERRAVVMQMLKTNFNTPLTSSCGRLFDGIAALLGLRMISTFEGQAAMQLESCARQALTSNWKDSLIDALDKPNAHLHREKEQRWEIISSEFVKEMVYDIFAGKEQPAIALQFHSWLISCITRLVEKLSGTTGITDIALSGGCMQNEILLDGLIFTLSELGFTVFTGTQIPVNDGGISVGQTVIGGLQHVSRSTDES